ncbi:MAG: glutamate--tRNA ligase [Vicinamibacterales bacterium]
MSIPLRLRFAPSPTGQLHVGNARTALFNWLLARGRGGTFVLRIEDTDVERSTKASEAAILEDLRWMGLTWDEGPDSGGDAGPYRQSERLPRYREAAERLRAAGLAYHCFCSADDLEHERQLALAAGQVPRYGGKCRALDPDASARRVASGEPAVVRFAIPDLDEVAFDDAVRGRVAFKREMLGDFVLVRSDGHPSYNFAVVVDDIAMQITHVIRGEDHVSNTPRQVLLYQALGATPPVFAHLSLVLGPDHAPLSKRHGATSVAEFRSRGYLPEALVNYLALLGWSPGENDELLGLAELARRFTLEGVGKSASVFDFDKLAWVNRHYLKQLDGERLTTLVLPFFAERGYVTDVDDRGRDFVRVVALAGVGAVDRLDEIPERFATIFDFQTDEATEHVVKQCFAEPGALEVVRALAAQLASVERLVDRDAFRAAVGHVKDMSRQKGRSLFHPIRVALTGRDAGPELDIVVPLIERGCELPHLAGVRPIVGCRERVHACLQVS